MLLSQEKRQDLKQIRESRILATRNQRISRYNLLFEKPQNKLWIKICNKVDMTYKSTKNKQITRSGDNSPSPKGIDDKATPKCRRGHEPHGQCEARSDGF